MDLLLAIHSRYIVTVPFICRFPDKWVYHRIQNGAAWAHDLAKQNQLVQRFYMRM